jgi:hypothetical protein
MYQNTDINNKFIIRRAHRIGNNIYLIKRTPDESLDVYYSRVGYITRSMSKMEKQDIEKAVTLSMIWRNKELFGMNYPSTVLRRL